MPEDYATLSRRLITVDEAARAVGCSPKTIRRWVSAGLLRGYKLGPRFIRVDVAELESLARAIPTAADAS